MAMPCAVCKKQKENIISIKTYNGAFVSACPECAESMKTTLNLIKLGGGIRKEER